MEDVSSKITRDRYCQAKATKSDKTLRDQPAGRVRDFIVEKKLAIEITVLEPEATRTSFSAAESLGCTVAEIAKTIAFLKDSNQERSAVLVTLSGEKRVSISKLSKYLNCDLRKMSAEEVKKYTGYAIGGVPPFPHDEEILVLADESLFRFNGVWAAAGASNAVMKINPEIFFELNIPKVDVSE